MHALLEFLPLIGFGGGYLIGKAVNPDAAMYYLSYGAIIGTLLQFAIYRLRKLKMQKTTLVTGYIFIIFAALTIILQNDLFVKLKPTVVSWAFALFFIGYLLIKKQSVLELMIGEQFSMPTANWIKLNHAWVIFNILVGLANLIVVWRVSKGVWDNDVWFYFKVALVPISLLFIVAQTVYLFKNGSVNDTPDRLDNDKRRM